MNYLDKHHETHKTCSPIAIAVDFEGDRGLRDPHPPLFFDDMTTICAVGTFPRPVVLCRRQTTDGRETEQDVIAVDGFTQWT